MPVLNEKLGHIIDPKYKAVLTIPGGFGKALVLSHGPVTNTPDKLFISGEFESINDKNVVFEVPDEIEASGYSKATKARLDGKKIKKLGWEPSYDIQSGVERTINILRKLNE